MNILFKKENLKLTILTLVYLALGVLFCVMPVKMFNFAESILCTMLLGVGIISVAIYALMPQEDKNAKLLVYGILAVSLGLSILMRPVLFGIVLSIIAGLGGLALFIESIREKKASKTWLTEFIVGIIVLLLSITAIILSGTSVAENILSIFFGVMFLTQAFYGVAQLVMLLKRYKLRVQEKKLNEQHIDEKKK